MKIQSINPATEEVNGEFELSTKEHALNVLKATRKAWEEWKTVDVSDRAKRMRNLATALRKKKAEYARLITIEMGKPIKQSLAEIEKCAWTAEIYADNGARWLEDERIDAGYKKSFVAFEPLGVVLSIMPWNFPFWQALRFGIPAITAGNATILRHSNNVPMCAYAIEEAFKEAGFPENLFRSLLTDHDTVKALIKHKSIKGVSFTGSTEVGKGIANLAGKNLKKCVLELGGSDPFIVLEDTNMSFTCAAAVEGRNISDGQSCIAAKRFIVVKDAATDFIAHFTELMSQYVLGDPLDQETDEGPLSSKKQLEKLESQVADAVRRGARIETGGKRPRMKGYYYEPTVLTHDKMGSRILTEEVFGPVAPIIVVKDANDAIRVANSTEYGLGASIWTSDLEKAEKIARQIEAGNVFINSIVKSDPMLPFGGIKASGIGRELSRYGLLEFVNMKSIAIK
jgi:acyl-CoA reductase-like NAD-dependent aldehyde dehydrogenase